MIQIIAGQKGKGKTKYLIDKANQTAKSSKGSIIYLDKNQKHMYELNNRIRLINVMEYPIESNNDLLAFICGIVSCDHDIELIYLDSFLKLANLEQDEITPTLKRLDDISNNFQKNFVLSISKNEEEIPLEYRPNIIISL